MDAPRSLARGLEALEIIHRHPQGLGFSVLARALGISDSVCSRMLGGLVELEFLCRTDTGLYAAGSRWQALCANTFEDLDQRLRRLAKPRLEYLREYSGNTVLLVRHYAEVQGKPYMHVLERLEHEESMALQAPGRASGNYRGPPWGWLFLSVDQVLSQEPNADGPTAEEVKSSLKNLPICGWTLREQADRRRLAAPIYDQNGLAIAALAVGGTPLSLPSENTESIGNELRRLAQEVSQGL